MGAFGDFGDMVDGAIDAVRDTAGSLGEEALHGKMVSLEELAATYPETFKAIQQELHDKQQTFGYQKDDHGKPVPPIKVNGKVDQATRDAYEAYLKAGNTVTDNHNHVPADRYIHGSGEGDMMINANAIEMMGVKVPHALDTTISQNKDKHSSLDSTDIPAEEALSAAPAQTPINREANQRQV